MGSRSLGFIPLIIRNISLSGLIHKLKTKKRFMLSKSTRHQFSCEACSKYKYLRPTNLNLGPVPKNLFYQLLSDLDVSHGVEITIPVISISIHNIYSQSLIQKNFITAMQQASLELEGLRVESGLCCVTCLVRQDFKLLGLRVSEK